MRLALNTTPAITLQADGFIRYTRGYSTSTDRQGLEDYNCEFYRIIKAKFDRLVG